MKDIEACVFDAYGTLLDIRSVTDALRGELGDKADAIGEIWRRKQLEYAWLRTLMGQFEDFWHVTGDSLDHAMDSVGIDDPGVRARLMQSYLNIKAYNEVAETLGSLKAARYKTAILTNGSISMITAAVSNAGIRAHLDHILSVDDIRAYKPDPKVYQFAVDTLAVDKERIVFLSSNGWDAAGAKQFGFNVVWVNRFGQRLDPLGVTPDAEIESLSELPALIGLQAGS